MFVATEERVVDYSYGGRDCGGVSAILPSTPLLSCEETVGVSMRNALDYLDGTWVTTNTTTVPKAGSISVAVWQ